MSCKKYTIKQKRLLSISESSLFNTLILVRREVSRLYVRRLPRALWQPGNARHQLLPYNLCLRL